MSMNKPKKRDTFHYAINCIDKNIPIFGNNLLPWVDDYVRNSIDYDSHFISKYGGTSIVGYLQRDVDDTLILYQKMRSLCTVYKYEFDEMFKTLNYEYNPIDNYDGYEKETTVRMPDLKYVDDGSIKYDRVLTTATKSGNDTVSKDGSDFEKKTGQDVNRKNGSEIDSHSGDDTQHHLGEDTQKTTAGIETKTTTQPIETNTNVSDYDVPYTHHENGGVVTIDKAVSAVLKSGERTKSKTELQTVDVKPQGTDEVKTEYESSVRTDYNSQMEHKYNNYEDSIDYDSQTEFEYDSKTTTEYDSSTTTDVSERTDKTGNTRNETGTETTEREFTRHGNMGVTTTQQMIKEQREVIRMCMFDYIIDKFYEQYLIYE